MDDDLGGRHQACPAGLRNACEGPGRWITSISCRDLPSPSLGVMLRIVDLARPKGLNPPVDAVAEPYLGSILSFGKRTRVRSFE